MSDVNPLHSMSEWISSVRNTVHGVRFRGCQTPGEVQSKGRTGTKKRGQLEDRTKGRMDRFTRGSNSGVHVEEVLRRERGRTETSRSGRMSETTGKTIDPR